VRFLGYSSGESCDQYALNALSELFLFVHLLPSNLVGNLKYLLVYLKNVGYCHTDTHEWIATKLNPNFYPIKIIRFEHFSNLIRVFEGLNETEKFFNLFSQTKQFNLLCFYVDCIFNGASLYNITMEVSVGGVIFIVFLGVGDGAEVAKSHYIQQTN
jgi:hypothetical protein